MGEGHWVLELTLAVLCCLEVSIIIALFTHKNVVPVFTAQTFLSSALKGTDFCNKNRNQYRYRYRNGLLKKLLQAPSALLRLIESEQISPTSKK